MNHLISKSDHPGYPFSGKSPMGSYYRGGTFESFGGNRKWRPVGNPRPGQESPATSTRRNLVVPGSQIKLGCGLERVGVKACRAGALWHRGPNKPAKPLHDAQLGGYFFGGLAKQNPRPEEMSRGSSTLRTGPDTQPGADGTDAPGSGCIPNLRALTGSKK